MKNVININIPKPCHENWNTMTLEEKGRHCNVCKKTVFDFTSKTDEYIVKSFIKNSNLCGRFKSTQLKRDLVFSRKEKNNYLSFVASGLFAVLGLTSQSSYSQGKPVLVQVDTLQNPPTKENINIKSENIIKGVIKGTNQYPIHDAIILIKGTAHGTITGFDGNFVIKTKLGDTLVISSLGFKTKEIEVNTYLPKTILLELDDQYKDDAVLTGVIVSYRTSYSSSEKIEHKRKKIIQKVKNVELKRTKTGKLLYKLTTIFRKK